MNWDAAMLPAWSDVYVTALDRAVGNRAFKHSFVLPLKGLLACYSYACITDRRIASKCECVTLQEIQVCPPTSSFARMKQVVDSFLYLGACCFIIISFRDLGCPRISPPSNPPTE